MPRARALGAGAAGQAAGWRRGREPSRPRRTGCGVLGSAAATGSERLGPSRRAGGRLLALLRLPRAPAPSAAPGALLCRRAQQQAQTRFLFSLLLPFAPSKSQAVRRRLRPGRGARAAPRAALEPSPGPVCSGSCQTWCAAWCLLQGWRERSISEMHRLQKKGSFIGRFIACKMPREPKINSDRYKTKRIEDKRTFIISEAAQVILSDAET